MKKTIKLFVLFIFLSFIYIGSVNAGVGPCGVTIEETSPAEPTGWNTRLPICIQGTRPSAGDETNPDHYYHYNEESYGKHGIDFYNLSQVQKIGTSTYQGVSKDIDNKGSHGVTLTVCNDSHSKVSAIYTCTTIPSRAVSSGLPDKVTLYGDKANLYTIRPDPIEEMVKNDPEYNFIEVSYDDEMGYEYNESIEAGRQCEYEFVKTGKCLPKHGCAFDTELIGTSYYNRACVAVTRKLTRTYHYQCKPGYTTSVAKYIKNHQSYLVVCTYDSPTETYTEEVVFNKHALKVTYDDVAAAAVDVAKNCEAALGKKCTCSSGEDGDEDSLFTKFEFLCPYYGCNEYGDSRVQACTPQFKYGDSQVYCVNPSQNFSPNSDGKADYQEDTDFDVGSCSSSYRSVDCGYANILIESEYYNTINKKEVISSEAVELALRLWGVHNNQAGFDGIGISRRTVEDKDPTNCNKRFSYSKTYNPYKFTYSYIWNAVLQRKLTASTTVSSKLSSMDYIDPTDTTLYTYYTHTCDSKDGYERGTICGTNVVHKQAMALLLNTIFGNKYMKEHLDALFGHEINEEVSSATLKVDKDNKSYIEVSFEEMENINIGKDVKIDCKHLDQMVKDGIITSANKAQIEPYCKVKVSITDANGKPLKNYKDKTPDECIKGVCIVKVENFAVCDIESTIKTPVKIKVSYNKSIMSASVKKYIACSNPNKSQVMFSFARELVELANDPKTEKIPTDKVFTINNYKCSDVCDETGVIENFKTTCNDDDVYGGVYKSNVKDPSLKCILNAKEEGKYLYDYSDYFGVNKNFCRIYCSDEIEYTIADKVKEQSGRSFYYDIEYQSKNKKEAPYLMASMIKEKRTCVSKSFYKNLPMNVDWKSMYSFTTSEYNTFCQRTDSTKECNPSFMSLFEAIVMKDGSKDGSGYTFNKSDNINEILYDMFNCNLYSDSKIATYNIYPVQSTNAYDRIKKIYSAVGSYGLTSNGECKIDISTHENTCVQLNDIELPYGASPDGTKVKMGATTYQINSVGDITYCSGENCFGYNAEDKDGLYKYPNAETTSTDGADLTKQYNRVKIGIKKLVVSGSETKEKVTTTYVDIPTNDYAMFDFEVGIDYYNDSDYVLVPGNGEAIYKEKANPNIRYMPINEFNFPLSVYAYNDSNCSDRNFLGKYKRCTIKQKFDMGTFYRASATDGFSASVKNHDTFTCYVDVSRPDIIQPPNQSVGGEIYTYYRTVDPSNIFPSTENGLPSNSSSNWNTEEGLKAIVDIENSASTLTNSFEYLEYRITLSPSQIKSIKNYNKNNGGYEKESLYDCDENFMECKSTFIQELRTSSNLGTIDEKYNGVNNKDDLRYENGD